MKTSRRSFLAFLGIAPFIAKDVAAATLEAMPPAPLDVLPEAVTVRGGSIVMTGQIPKLLWPGLNEIWGSEYQGGSDPYSVAYEADY